MCGWVGGCWGLVRPTIATIDVLMRFPVVSFTFHLLARKMVNEESVCCVWTSPLSTSLEFNT